MGKLSFLCPVCRETLTETGHGWVCANRHNFDKAKSGYVNLLLANAKHAKIPGDNKQMVQARRAFLEKGYYQKLADALCEQAVDGLSGIAHPAVLDAGCGEGYYTSAVEQQLSKVCKPTVLGADISKFALDAAAKRNKQVRYGVASVFHLPVADDSCDAVMNLFAPYCGEEFRRVLKANGLLFLVIPGRRHLWELKEAVYDAPYENEVKDYALEGFTLIRTVRIADTIALTRAEDIQNLFCMTPYSYKTSASDTARLQKLEHLTTGIEFELLVYRKAE